MQSDRTSPPYSQVIDLDDGLQCVLAPNPSPMTYTGTNTYLLGGRSVAVIDPGPADDAHLCALQDALNGRQVSHIIVTHSHLDHSPLARRLSEWSGAPVLAFGDSDAGRSAVMARLAASGYAGGGEGVDRDFVPDVTVSDGEILAGDGWALQVLHTPGHMGNHISLVWKDRIFCGDLVMGWASSMVSPPDGDLNDFMASCARLRALAPSVLYPGHGAPIEEPLDRIDWLIDHRDMRSRQIMQTLRQNPQTVQELTSAIYTDVAPALHPAAARNVFAHLIKLHEDRLAEAQPNLAFDARFAVL